MDSKGITDDSETSTGGGTGNATMGSGGVQPLSDSLLAVLSGGEGSSSAVGQLGNKSAGADWTKNVLTVLPGEDAVEKILRFAPSHHNGICIMSGSGSASSAQLHNPDGPATTYTSEDSSFKILTLSGSFTFPEDGNRADRTGNLTVEMMTNDGEIGGNALKLIASDPPIKVEIGSFYTADQVLRLNSQQEDEVPHVITPLNVSQNTMVVPPWLESLLKTQFFIDCHYCRQSSSRSNRFCFDCNNVPAFCSGCQQFEHNNHRVLQIKRCHGHDSVRESEIKEDFELNDVQKFELKNEHFVYINKRPKEEGRRENIYGVTCENCHFTLTSIPIGFCSLGCKVEGMKKSNVDNAASSSKVEEGNGD